MAHEVKCIIAACDNSKTFIQEVGKEIWFYEFPTDPELRHKWLRKCGKGDNWDTSCCYVCSEHFPEEDFESTDIELEPSVQRKLIHTALPVLKLQNECEILESIQEGNEFSITQYFSDEQTVIDVTADTVKNIESTSFIPAESYEQLLQKYQKVDQLNNDLKRYLRISTKSLDKTRQIQKLEKEVIDLRFQLDAERAQSEGFEQALKYFFTGAQKHFVVGLKIDGEWNTEVLVETLAIRYLSERCYNYLCKNLVYSLPDLASVQQWIAKISFRQGILHEFLYIMQITARELKDNEKIAVLQMGRMKIKSMYEYEKVTDEVVGPYSYMQVIVVTALFAKWKQPIYFAFDSQLTSKVILELIKKLHDMSYTILACISDWYDDISDLWKQLKITSKKSYFHHPITDEKVYYFLDALSLLKTIHSIFIEEGFAFNTGKTVSVEPFKDLVSSRTGTQYSSMLNKKYFQATRDERHNLKLADQLFCQNTATDLKRSTSSLSYSTGVFIETITNWYIVARQSYGSKMYEQNLKLNNASDMISKLVITGTKVHLLQEAMLMSINSLRLLPLNLWQRYKTIYDIPAEKLNNNELMDLFSQISGEVNSVTPPNAIKQLRMIMLGKNEKNEDYLTQKVILSLDCPEIQHEEEESTSLNDSLSTLSSIVYTEDDEVHYLVATVAEKFLSSNPKLGTRIQDLTLDPPYENTLVNIGSFVEPSDLWATQARQLNKIFIKFHKKELLTETPNITKQLIDVVKRLYPAVDLKVARCFLVERLMLRIKYLNAEIEKSQAEEETRETASCDDQCESPKEGLGV